MLTVTVQDGTVELWGLVQSVEVKKAARLTTEHTAGVRAVVDNIIVQPRWFGLATLSVRDTLRARQRLIGSLASGPPQRR
jgi:hypothetical protein